VPWRPIPAITRARACCERHFPCGPAPGEAVSCGPARRSDRLQAGFNRVGGFLAVSLSHTTEHTHRTRPWHPPPASRYGASATKMLAQAARIDRRATASLASSILSDLAENFDGFERSCLDSRSVINLREKLKSDRLLGYNP
jgi:hypothetical protein